MSKMSKDWINEFFGENPRRPDHPDMMKISEVLLAMDGRMGPGQSEEKNQSEWERTIAEVGIDLDVVSYAAIQRAMRAHKVETRLDLTIKAPQVINTTGAWLDGFVAGARYRQKLEAEVSDAQE